MVMDRTELIELRPLVAGASTENSKPIETFQNEALRPVIKMQHEIIISSIGSNEQFKQFLVKKGARIDFHNRIHNYISKQQDIKNQLIGMVLGMLTLQEFDFYHQHQNELNKRITQMISQRISDTFY
jgi:hypothetical protein